MKAIDLITRALKSAKVLGGTETPTADMASDGLQILNDMLDSWSVSRLYVYQLLEENFPLTVGKSTYLIGPGADFSTTRPVKIDSCYVRYNGIDYPVTQIDNDAYSEIALKTTIPSIPQFLYYDPQTPSGEINLWPNPSQPMSLYLQTPKQLTQFPDLVTDIIFPPGYAEALRYALAARLANEFGMPVTPLMMDLGRSAIERMQTANSSAPVLKPEFSTSGNGRFNIFRGY